jgi:hypothetical protein
MRINHRVTGGVCSPRRRAVKHKLASAPVAAVLVF